MAKSSNYDITYNPFRYYVDIIIPYHKQYTYVRKLLESLLQLTSKPIFRITLVDDGSPNDSFGELFDSYGADKFITDKRHNRYSKIQTIRLEEQQGFGAALKAGFDATVFPYVCFLNSDCVIKNSLWLQHLGNSILEMKEYNVGLVSARTNNSVSDVPELEGEPGDLEDDIVIDQFLPLYCALAERSMFEKIGGFIKPYPYGMYEDEELFNRMSYYGYRQGISNKAWVFHHGEVTLQEFVDDPEVSNEIIEGNHQRLQADINSLGQY